MEQVDETAPGTGPGNPESLRQTARRLRLDGLSTPQIADRVRMSVSTVRDWVADLPVPAWATRPNAKDAHRARARELRLAGRTYPEIAAELGVSKSSVSLWVRDLPKPARNVERGKRAAEARWAPVRRATAIHRQQIKLAAGREVGELTDRELLLVGAALYWAEGSKDKPDLEHRRERIQFVNSDADVIRLFLRWLALCGVDPSDLRFHVMIHERADVAGAERFWREVVGADESQFGKTTLKRHNPKTVRLNTGDRYRGCLIVRVLRSADLYRRMEGWWYGIVVGAQAAADSRSNMSDST